MIDAEIEDDIRARYERLEPAMDERLRRLWAANEAAALPYGGIAAVERATGISRTTIREGIAELDRPDEVTSLVGRVRRVGAGRPTVIERDPALVEALERLIDPVTRGDPMSPLRWTAKSARTLARELGEAGHAISPQKVCDLLKELDYSLQGTRKAKEGSSHPDRDAQFQYINRRAQDFQRRGQPVVSVDTKKKELIGEYANGGREWRPEGNPIEVKVHDFPDPAVPKAVPYGVYDLRRNEGWVSVGISHDTSDFAIATIRRWWYSMGIFAYPEALELLITADAGGSNSYRARAWKRGLQRLADETGLKLAVCHFPPGTSKWNKIEHRMFCHITHNWRGQPLVSYEAVVNLIAHTTTDTGLYINASLDDEHYPKGLKVSDDELAAINIWKGRFHGEWNYRVRPRS
jgi:Rhodopirellula transposase DDE domain